MRIAYGSNNRKLLNGLSLLLITLAVTITQLYFADSYKSADGPVWSFSSGAAISHGSLPGFSGEPIPHDDTLIMARLEKHLLSRKQHLGQYRLWMYRAKTWFPVIEPILKKHGIPDDFKYVALVESNLSNVISPRGAAGFWQFVPESGSHYGLEINMNVDERYDWEKSTIAACKYFKEAYAMFGSWTLAAASYNIGLGGILDQVRANDSVSYYDMKLNMETSAYIYKLLAIKELMERPRYYGIIRPGRVGGSPPRFTTLEVTESTAVQSIAEVLGMSEDKLRHINPWLVGDSLPVAEGKTYKIRIPGEWYSPDALPELHSPHHPVQKPDTSSSALNADSLKMSNFAVRDTGGRAK